MIILSWNCRGLGNLRAVPSFRDLVRTNKLDVLFLSETLVGLSRIEELRIHLGFSSCFTVECNGKSSGLALFWRDSIKCNITSYSPNFIDAEVLEDVVGQWRLTSFYGFPESTRRRDCWSFLQTLASVSNLPWCVIGT